MDQIDVPPDTPLAQNVGHTSIAAEENLTATGDSLPTAEGRLPENLQVPVATGQHAMAITEAEYARDTTFYDDAIVFSVESVNFRVSRILLERGSSVFRAMLSLPQGGHGGGAPKEGTCDGHPINLPGITADEFREFLRVLYANLVEIDKCLCGIRNVPSDWIPVLKPATLWEFDTVRKEAIGMLRGWDPVTRIVLAQTYHINGWMEDAIYALAHQDEPLESKDFDAVGLDLAVSVVKLREIVLKHPNRMLDRPTEWLKNVGDVFSAKFVASLKQEWPGASVV